MPSAEVRVLLQGKTPSLTASSLCLKPGANLVIGDTAFRRQLGQLTSLERDVLTLAATIYASDLAIQRGDRETYARRLRIDIPLVNQHAFALVRDKLTYCLALLSSDRWDINFTRVDGIPEATQSWAETDGVVLLFSGGLDSLAQGVHLAEAGARTWLVSHESGNAVTSAAQQALARHLQTIATGGQFSHLSFRVRGQNSGNWKYPVHKEPSQRSRSFLFLSLGALVARRTGASRILFMAENGQMAIHVPLTAARIGAFSTRTAHPEALVVAQELFSELLGFKLTVENPFLYSTKAEVVERLRSPKHSRAVEKSVSCWMASRLTGEASHCGACVPCIVRRIALEHWGKTKATEWARDLLREDLGRVDPDDDGKKNLLEIVELVTDFSSTATDAELMLNYPELVSKHFSMRDAIEMYRRFSVEAKGLFTRYPEVRKLM